MQLGGQAAAHGTKDPSEEVSGGGPRQGLVGVQVWRHRALQVEDAAAEMTRGSKKGNGDHGIRPERASVFPRTHGGGDKKQNNMEL